MTPAAELALLDTWTAGQRGGRGDHITHLTRLVLGPDALRAPWDVATAGLLALAAGDGEAVEAVVTCSGCSASVEVDLPVHALLAGTAPKAGAGAGPEGVAVPVVDDVVAAALDPARAEARLAAACGLDRLDAAERARALAALDEAHPLLAPSVALSCPTCGADVDAAVDAVALAWAAVDERARACLDDVTVLARAFGWSEAEVLAVPAARRSTYRQLLQGGDTDG